WPVGLKNVGNSCWFSVVVQSLFHIPVFRSIILKFGPTLINPSLSPETKRNLRLMQELRCLFALMITSNKSFLDPSKCVNIIQEAFQTKSSDSQQDVSEFTHMLLDWLEEAFLINDLRNPTKPITNPVQELFYGTSKTVGVNMHGIKFEQEHTFGILPLCVEGHKNLHESLEYATAKVPNESSQGGPEVWFTKLPPILTFQLSRFQFNQTIGKPEKVHNRLIFPSILHMDRYMECNALATRTRRDEIKKLQGQLGGLKLKLNRLLNFVSNEKSYNLSELLSTCAEYAMHKSCASNSSELNSICRRSGTESPSYGLSPNKRSKEEEEAPSHHDNRPESASSSTSNMSCSSVTDEEAHMVGSILQKWKSEVESKIAAIKEKIEETQLIIDKMFDDPNDRKFSYSLHAVLVHQGQALAGHYWAYVRDYVNRRWLKFNDVSVTEETYDQLTNDSIGGVHSYRFYGNSASAYCLIYVDNRKIDLSYDSSPLQTDKILGVIASDTVLANLVNEHNQQLENELEHWDVERAKELSLESKSLEMEIVPTDSMQKCASPGGAWNLTDLKNAVHKVSSTYTGMGPEKALEKDITCPVFQASIFAILQAGKTYNLEGPEAALHEAISEEMIRLKELSYQVDSITTDSRLQNIVVYLYQNKAPRKVIERCVLEQFTDERLQYDSRASDIMKCAQEKLANLSPEDLDVNQYQYWQGEYKLFCTAMCHFVDGMEMFRLRKFFSATQHFAAVYDHQFDLNSIERGVDLKMLGRYCRTCVKRVHEDVMLKVQSPNLEDGNKGLKMMRRRLIPCISLLLREKVGGKSDQDLQLADLIREDWCSLLEQSDGMDTLSTALSDFLEANHSTVKIKQCPPITKPSNLCQRYEQVMTSF
uniref:Ubiquitin carboxyl-terminal hydrolase n=1 Tax=Ciona savignyi TaxID=51511 RepID=H2YB36_CIOSA